MGGWEEGGSQLPSFFAAVLQRNSERRGDDQTLVDEIAGIESSWLKFKIDGYHPGQRGLKLRSVARSLSNKKEVGFSEVAKGAAAMILTDDNFVSIVGAVEKGRVIYAGIQKFVSLAFEKFTKEI